VVVEVITIASKMHHHRPHHKVVVIITITSKVHHHRLHKVVGCHKVVGAHQNPNHPPMLPTTICRFSFVVNEKIKNPQELSQACGVF
jgi:hypothetical protein